MLSLKNYKLISFHQQKYILTLLGICGYRNVLKVHEWLQDKTCKHNFFLQNLYLYFQRIHWLKEKNTLYIYVSRLKYIFKEMWVHAHWNIIIGNKIVYLNWI